LGLAALGLVGAVALYRAKRHSRTSGILSTSPRLADRVWPAALVSGMRTGRISRG
jgi:hypothetical protein